MKQLIAFRTQTDAVTIRTETMFGREYTVIPVVALVEGVLQGMNAETPELALASEFGAVPPGWDGRPVVMNHPVVDGSPVSANSPTILESYAFGQLFNTTLEDGKLKTEAWLDNERITALGGEFADVLTRLNAGKIIEVSTGLFTATEEKSGTFNGKKYNAVWRKVVPDHLAFLSEGVLGACSVEDGCGTPRVNNQAGAPNPWTEYTMPAEIKANCGGNANCTCGNKGEGENVVTLSSGATTFEALRTNSPHQQLSNNEAPANMVSQDIYELLNKAVRAATKPGYAWLLGFTAQKVIYEIYSEVAQMYLTYQRSYTISDDTAVMLGDDIQEVTLLTQIVPTVNGGTTKTTTPSTNSQNEETEMAGDSTNTNPAATEADPAATATTTTSATADPAAPTTEVAAAPTTNAAPAPTAPRTMSQYLEDMPAEMREVFQSGLKLHSQKKDAIITALKASGRCKFSDEQLKTMSMDMLENLSSLAAVPSFEGVATPRTNASDDNAVPPAPKVFVRNAANAA